MMHKWPTVKKTCSALSLKQAMGDIPRAIWKDELTNDSDCKGAVGLVSRAVRRNVGDGLLSDGEQLGRSVHWFHLHRHLKE